MVDVVQEYVDRFYWANGPCCAGCDRWTAHTSSVGLCKKSAPVAAADRPGPLGISGVSMNIGAGKVMTPRDYHCDQFKDAFDWSTLPPHYLRTIGADLKRGLPAANAGVVPDGDGHE